ncbi:hypothetical protein [Nostoc sp.]|uniref:hypothetical protein n=1 Tax=Nostoc sp. TaxID=1180 RepID=UPI002FF6210F
MALLNLEATLKFISGIWELSNNQVQVLQNWQLRKKSPLLILLRLLKVVKWESFAKFEVAIAHT